MKNKRGFTLIEMIVTIALILMLTTVFTSSLVSYIGKAQYASTGVDSHLNKYDAAKTAVDGLGHGVTATPAAVTPAVTVKVTYNSNGGSAVGESEVAIGAVIPEPSAPTKSGYTFVGWYSDAGCYSLWNFGTDTVAGAMTLYANWISEAAATYSVTFNYKTAAGVDTQSTVSNIPSGGSATPPATTGYPGFAFDYWQGTYTNITSNQPVTAKYKAIALAPTLVADGSWGSYISQYKISLKNTSSTNITNWTITITVPAGSTIASSWNGTYSISGTTLTITPASYNNNINAGATATDIGFQLSTTNAFTASSPTTTSS